jgi:hypothetical protein
MIGHSAGPAYINFFNVSTHYRNLSMTSFLRRLTAWAMPLAGLSFLACPQPSHAILTYYIYESGPNVVVETSGELQLPQIQTTTPEGCEPLLIADQATVCTGPLAIVPGYNITGPTSFASEPGIIVLRNSSTGITTWLWGLQGAFYIDGSYISGTPIVSSSTITDETLTSIGLTTTGLLGTWTLLPKDGDDPYIANDTIRLVVGQAPPADVPGPLPLLGIGAAFSVSRRLRRRVSQAMNP